MNTLTKTAMAVFVAAQISACSQNDAYTPPPNITDNSPFSPIFQQGETNLTMVSYNLKGIPPIFESDIYTEHNSDRATEFASYLRARMQQGAAPDVVLLQEIFDPAFLATLISNTDYPYYYTDYIDNYSLGNLASGEIKAVPSGLLILSKYPITESAVHHFPNSLCALDDCYAKKGVLWVKIQKPGVPFQIDIFNTHIQARVAQELIREQQVNDMTVFVNSHVEKASAVFFGGDFNFRLNDAYRVDDLFLRLFKLTDSFSSCSQLPSCTSDFQTIRVNDVSDLLDHIFYKANSNSIAVNVLQARASEQKINLNGQEIHLSDHPMLEFSYLLRWK